MTTSTTKPEHEGPIEFVRDGLERVRLYSGHDLAKMPATAADLIACLTANPQLRAAVLGAIDTEAEWRGLAEKRGLELAQQCSELHEAIDSKNAGWALAKSRLEALEAATEKLRLAESGLAAERARAVRYQQERNHYRETALRYSQQPAPPPAEQARLCATCKAPECPRSILGPDTYCDGYKRAPAEQAKDSAPSVPVTAGSVDATDSDGASPGEAEETVTHGQAREWVEALFAGAPWGTDLHSYIDQQAQVESGLKHAVDDAVATLNKVETERDELRRKLGQTKLDFANACDRGRRLEAKLEAAEAELQRQSDEWAHLLEAGELLRAGSSMSSSEWEPRKAAWKLRDHELVSPSTAARSGSVGGEAAAAGEEKPWPQVGDVARLVSADSDITRSALRNEHLIGLAIGDEGTVSSLDDGCCNLLAGDGHTWTVATRDLRPSCLSAPEEPHCWCQRCEDDEGTISPFAARMKLCPHCGNKHCPKAEWHGYQCTGSNETGQVGVEEGKHPTQPPAPDSPGGGRDYCPKCDKCMVPMNGICNCGERLVEAPADYEARYVTAQPLTLADVDRRIAEERAVLVAAMRRVGACGMHVTGPAALERLADALAEAAEAGKP